MSKVNRYYSEQLSAQNLRRCYEIASPRVQQYLEAEIQYVLDRIRPDDALLELGCGYGRILSRMSAEAENAVGIDSSQANLTMGADFLRDKRNCRLLQMDAALLAFKDRTFDLVACLQNGLSAFKVDPAALFQECLRVTKSGGRVIFSSYSERFWPHRLEWFAQQAKEGLLGEIDPDATGNGVIVCRDGFRATTFSEEDFISLASRFFVQLVITEVDGSSLFCEIVVP
jgi:2-polyprenyl-6-hydroxyphenyl methylase/3-demethylubiquinone-9 3-methyltransferase